MVEGMADQEIASFTDAVFVVGVGVGDEDPDDDPSVLASLRVAGEGADLVAQAFPSLAAAAADLGDEVMVPGFDEAGVLVVKFEHGKDLLDQCFVFWVVHAWPS